MRFNVVEKEKSDIRTKKRFLVFPRTIKGERRWLEWATWKEKRFATGGWEDFDSEWRGMEWLDEPV